MNTQEQAWLTRANPAEESYVQFFLEKGIIAIGWGDVGDLSDSGYEEIKNRIMQSCDYLQSPGQLRIPLSALHHFKNSIQVGDYVLMPGIDSSKIHIGQIVGEYHFNGDDTLIAHRRNVLWSPSTVSRNRLTEELRGSLQTQRTIANFSKYFHEIAELYDREEFPIQSITTYSVEIKIRMNQVVHISGIPKDITADEVNSIRNIIAGFVHTGT